MAVRALLAAFGALFLLGVSAGGGAIPGPYCLPVKKELRSIPVAFTATTLTGRTLEFSNQSGRPAVVGFFATWCEPCNEEMPEFLRVAHRYSREGFDVVLIDDGEPPKTVQRFIDKFGIDFPVAIDSDFGIEALCRPSYPGQRLLQRKGRIDVYGTRLVGSQTNRQRSLRRARRLDALARKPRLFE